MAKKAAKKRRKAPGGKQTRADKPVIQAAPTSPTAPAGMPPPATAVPAINLPPAIQAEHALQKRQAAEKWTGPKRDKVKKTVAAIVALQIQGYSTEEIAKQLNLKPASVRQYKWIAGKQGWLTTHDPHELAHSKLVHRAVSNAEEWLHARDARTGLPDKEFTLEAMKGFGVFGGGPAQQQESQATNVLAISITMPQGGNLPTMRDGNAGGAPSYIDGEVINAPVPPRRQLAE